MREAETGCAPVDEQAKNPDHDEILTANETQPCAEEATSRLERKIAALEEENSDLKDKLLRKAADFENFRKRMFREREETARYANTALLTDLIGTIDDFERAIRSAGESHDFTTFFAGVELIEKQLVEKLEQTWNLRRFSALGEAFDPNRHEAVLSEVGDTDVAVVTEEYQKGYFLHERVVRPAKVKVMVPRASETIAAPSTEPAPENSN